MNKIMSTCKFYLDLFIHNNFYNGSSKYVIELGALHLDTITTTYTYMYIRFLEENDK